MVKRCLVDGCCGKHVARGYCNMHWKRWRKYGDPLKTVELTPVTMSDATTRSQRYANADGHRLIGVGGHHERS